MAKIKQIQIGEDTFDLGVNAENIDGYITEIPIASSQTLGGIKVGDNLEITEDGTLSAVAGGGSSITYIKTDTLNLPTWGNITDDTIKNAIADEITAKLGTSIKPQLEVDDGYTSSSYMYTHPRHQIYTCDRISTTTSNSYTFVADIWVATYYDDLCVSRRKITVDGSWADNKFTVTSASYGIINNYTIVRKSDVLTTTNTSSYTPTANYHPATKKYVDDTIASAITTTLGGEY